MCYCHTILRARFHLNATNSTKASVLTPKTKATYQLLLLLSLALFLLAHVIIFCIAWARAPSWAKSKRRDSHGKHYFEIIGQIQQTDQSLLERVKFCADHLWDQTKQVNRDEPFLGIRMLFSYVTLVLHRSLLGSNLSHDDRDRILTSDGELAGSVPRDKLEGFLEQIKFAKWAHPFDPNYTNLETCLREEGYLLLEQNTTTAPGRLAHYVAINSTTKVLLVVPRGSCAVSDIVTDAVGNLVSQKLGNARDPGLEEIYSHEGVLLAANALAEKIAPLVDRLVTTDDYKLHIVGHSLGAAAGSVMGAILQSKIHALNDPTRLHIWAFASPPCLNEEASQAMEPFLSSIVWNDDVIPTLSVPNYVFTCKMVAHMEQKEKEYYRFCHLPRALISAITTSLGWQTHSLSEERQEAMIDYALEHTIELHKERQHSDIMDVCVPGKVMCLWERQHWSQATGEVNGVTASGSKLLHLAMFIPTKGSFNDHFLGSHEHGTQQLLNQLGDQEEHRPSNFRWEKLETGKLKAI